MGACQCQPLTSSSPCFFRAASPPQSLLALVHDGGDGDDGDDDDDEGERRARPARAEEQTAGGGRRARRIGHGRAAIEVGFVIFPSFTCSSCIANPTMINVARTLCARRRQRARRRTQISSRLAGSRTTPLPRLSPSSDAATSTRICDDYALSLTPKAARRGGGL